MAKFIITICALIATASAGPGLVAPLAGLPLAYSSPLTYSSPLGYSSPLAYSSPLTYSAPLAYTSPVAYGLASGGSSRVDIQNNYNVAPQFAVPFATSPLAYTAASPFAARIAAPYVNAAPFNFNVAQYAAPQFAKIAAAPVAAGASLAAAPVSVAAPTPFAAPQFTPAPFKYSAPLLSNYNTAAAFYGNPLSYAFPGQINALPFAASLTAAPGALTSGPLTATGIPLGSPLSVATTRMTAVPAENSEADSEEIPAKLMSETPASESDDQKFATPAPVDGPQVARDASSVSQSPVAPVRNN